MKTTINKIPFVDLKREANLFLPELLSITKKVLESGNYINGQYVKEFESSVADYLGVKYAISVGNGSDALTFILRSLNLEKDDEVICPANSFIATAWSIIAAGLKPVFCDVNDDFLLDPDDFKRKINKNTKAVIPVHLTGRVFEINSINEICEKHSIYIIEDAAQSFGAYDSNRTKTGGIGIAGAFSLHPLKNLNICGDGGVITTNDLNIAQNCKLLRNHGLINRDEAKIWGFNSRLDELQAGFALIKLKEIENLTNRYLQIAKFYDAHLMNQICKPKIRTTLRDVYHNYVIRVGLEIRDDFMKRLLEKGVETKIHYPIPLHLQECSGKLGYKIGDIPKVEKFSKTMVSLPIYPGLESWELNYIVETVNETYKELI